MGRYPMDMATVNTTTKHRAESEEHKNEEGQILLLIQGEEKSRRGAGGE